MTTTTTTLSPDLTVALTAARDELLAAKAAKAAKDTPANRKAVEDALTRINELFDGRHRPGLLDAGQAKPV